MQKPPSPAVSRAGSAGETAGLEKKLHDTYVHSTQVLQTQLAMDHLFFRLLQHEEISHLWLLMEEERFLQRNLQGTKCDDGQILEPDLK